MAAKDSRHHRRRKRNSFGSGGPSAVDSAKNSWIRIVGKLQMLVLLAPHLVPRLLVLVESVIDGMLSGL